MITERQKLILRREPRYKVNSGRDVQVTIEITTDGETAWQRAELVDLSRNGAKLSISSAIPSGSTVRLHLRVPELDFRWQVESRLRWVRPRSADRWWAGCSFAAEMAQADLQRLAEGGFLDQRLDPRQGITVNIKAKRELSSTSQTAVRLENFSVGGFRLFSPEPANVGQRILLKLEGSDGKPIEIPAEVRWQLESDGGQAIGCNFLNKDGYQLLRQAMNRLRLKPEPPPESVRQVRPWVWASLAAAAFCFSLSKIFF